MRQREWEFIIRLETRAVVDPCVRSFGSRWAAKYIYVRADSDATRSDVQWTSSERPRYLRQIFAVAKSKSASIGIDLIVQSPVYVNEIYPKLTLILKSPRDPLTKYQ